MQVFQGHCWVVMAILAVAAMGGEGWALPVEDEIAPQVSIADLTPENLLPKADDRPAVISQTLTPGIPDVIAPPPPLPEPVPQPQPLPDPPFTLPNPVTPPPPDTSDIPGTVTLTGFEFVGNTVFSHEELAKVTAEFTNRPITFAELLQVEVAIAKLYTDAGYINSGAIILAGQNLSSGIVTVQIVEGGVEQIIVTGTGRLNANYVRSRLAIAASRPLNTNRLLQALQLLQLDPLIQNISAELSAGPRPDLSVLEVRVKPAKTFNAQFILDNGRSPSVGTLRRGIEFSQANLLGWGDALRGNYTNTEGSNAVEMSYTVPVNPRNGTVSFAYSRTGSQIVEPPFDRVDITGKSNQYELTFRQPIYQRPTQEFALGLTASHQDSQTTILGAKEPLSVGADEDGKTVVSALRFFQEWTQRSPQSVFAVRSQFSLGVGALGATINPDPPDSRFFAWRGQAQYVRLLAPETLLVLRSDLQLADRALVPLEQIGLGGFRSVRGYRQDVLLTDNGLLMSAELQVPIVRFGPGNLLQLIPFIDYGQGWNSAEDSTPEKNQLLGAGLGLQLRLGNHFLGRFEYGIPLLESGDSRDRTWQENGIYFSIIYNPF